GDIVELVLEQLAGELQLLGNLELVLRVGDLLDRLRRAVEVDADVPLGLPIAGDGLEVQPLRDVRVQRDRATEGVVFGEARARGVGRIDTARVGGSAVPVDPGARRTGIARARRVHGTRRSAADVARAAERSTAGIGQSGAV